MMDKDFFVDGSCFDGQNELLASAGFSIVQLDEEHGVARAVRAILPRDFEQNANSAEHCAVSFLNELIGEEASAALRDALGTLKGAPKAGVIGSLAVRGDKKALPALKAIAADAAESAEVREAAERAATALSA